MKWVFGTIAALIFLASCSNDNGRAVQVQTLNQSQRQQLLEDLKKGRVHIEDSVPQHQGCQNFINELPADYGAAYLSVPENWDQPEGRKIKLLIYGQFNDIKNPVIFYNGGPASDSHSSYSNISKLDDSKDFNFIYMDQRGTGCSTPFPSEKNAETIQRLKHYTSRSIVRDSEYLREQLLGVQGQWKIFGQSYGGLIVHRYMSIAPQFVTSAHSHGYSVMSDGAEWLKFRMLSQKRVIQDYLKVYPEDAAKISKLKTLVDAESCFKADSQKVCGPATIDALTIFLGFKSSWPSLHSLLDRLLVKGELHLPSYKLFVQNYVLGIYGNQYAAGSVISFMEMGGEAHSINFCPTVEERLKNEGEDTSTWLINECRVLSAITDSDWDPLFKTIGAGDPLSLALIRQSLVARPKPFYVYSGLLDVFVPTETFKQEVEFLSPLIQYTDFPNSGHEGFLTEKLVWDNLKK